MNNSDVLAALEVLQKAINTKRMELAEAIKEATLQGQFTQAQRILAKVEVLERAMEQIRQLREVWEEIEKIEEPSAITTVAKVEDARIISGSEDYSPELALVDRLFGERKTRRRRRRLPVNKTPEAAFRLPILEALAQLGGKGYVKEVLGIVYDMMKDRLTEDDRERLPSGRDIRWRKTAQWERYNMVKEGLLRDDSPQGIWEMTEKGWAYLEQARKQEKEDGKL